MQRFRSFVLRNKTEGLDYLKKLRADESGYIYWYKKWLFNFGFWPTDANLGTSSLGDNLRYLNSRFSFGITCALAFIVLPVGTFQRRNDPVDTLIEPLLYGVQTIGSVIVMASMLYRTEVYDNVFEDMELMLECASNYRLKPPSSITDSSQRLLDLLFMLTFSVFISLCPTTIVLTVLMIARKTIIIGY